MKNKIYQATESDTETLAYILTQSWKAAYSEIISATELAKATNPDHYEKIFDLLLKMPNNYFYIAASENVPCGMIFSCPSKDNDLAGYGEIVALYTMPDCWGKGIGKALLQTALTKIREENKKGVYLWVFKENFRARKFYEKNGFVSDGKEKQENFSNKPISVRYVLNF